MKTFKFLIAIIFLAICFQSCDQKPKKVNKTKKIKSLTLKKKISEKYYQGINIQGFSVDKAGVLRPDKDYEIVILDDKKQFLVKPKGVEYKMVDNIEVMELPGGSTMVCHCGFGAGDNCQINLSSNGGDTSYKCQGSCSCGSFFIDVVFHVAQFETMDGN